MKIHEALRTHLATDVGVAAIASTRIYGGMIPQTKIADPFQPTVVFKLASRADARGIGGIILKASQFSVFCVASNYDAAHSLADAVEVALEGFKGIMGGVGGVDVTGCLMTAASDEPDVDLNLNAVSLGFSITFRQ